MPGMRLRFAPLLFVPALAAAGPPQGSANDHFRAGLAAEASGDVAPARSAYRRALELEPDHGRAAINLGLLEIRQRRPAEGMALCQRALAQAGDAAKAHYCLGLGHLRLGDAAAAEVAFEKALELHPSEPAPKIELAHLARKAKRFEAAVQLYREAVRLAPDSPDLHVHLGYCYRVLGQYPAAEVEYRKAVQKEPQSFFGHLDLGWVLVKRGDDAEAEIAYRRAAELDPRHPDPPFNLGNLYRRQGALKAAVEAYARAHALDPKRPEHVLELARTHWLAGEPQPAKARLAEARALALTPEQQKAVEALLARVDQPPPKRVTPAARAPRGSSAPPAPSSGPAE